MTPTVEILVQHHPSRAARAAALVEALGGGVLVADPEPTAARSGWRSYAACLRYPTEAPYRCIVQDDCTPLVERFAELLPRLVDPTRLVSLYSGSAPARAMRAIHLASDAGKCWATLPRGDWIAAQALIWPAPLVERFLAWIETRPRIGLTADDGLIGAWMRNATDVPEAVCSVPNLIQHADDLPTIGVAHSRHRYGANPQRTSCCTPWPDCDLHAIPWERG
jgi:hypothetical protein